MTKILHLSNYYTDSDFVKPTFLGNLAWRNAHFYDAGLNSRSRCYQVVTLGQVTVFGPSENVAYTKVKLAFHHCVLSKNRTPKAGWHKFIKISSPKMIFHTVHCHSAVDSLRLKSLVWA